MQELTFEESLKRLEEIVTQLEGTKLALEQSLQVFEEGVKLVRSCAGRLEDAERRIEILLADKEGQLHVEPFPEELEDTTGAAERP